MQLPSGAVAPLEPAGLRRLLSCGGTRLGICQAVWAHPSMEAVEALANGKDDACWIAAWAVEQFVATDEAAELAAVCQTYGQVPSQRLGISDRVIAFDLDQGCTTALNRYVKLHGEAEKPVFNSGSVNE